MLERVRQVDQLRQFLTGHLPLLIVDLAFVGLFLAVLLALTRPGAGHGGRDAVFVLLSVLGSAASRRTSVPASAPPAPRPRLGRGRRPGAHRQVAGARADMERRFERHLLRSAWTGLQSGRIAHVAGSLGQALQHLTALVLVYLGARMIVAGDMTVGALVAGLDPLRPRPGPDAPARLAWSQFQQAREAIGRLDELLAERGRGQRPAGRGRAVLVQGQLGVEA